MIGRLEEVLGDPVSRETYDRLGEYAELLRTEARFQNLVSASTLENLWERHILDSAQLVRLLKNDKTLIDVGSGAGLPGIVIAILSNATVTLAEPRRLRADFLRRVSDDLGLHCVKVAPSKAERVTGEFQVITARAVAPIDKLLGITRHLATPDTLWILPKGRNANSELAEAQRSWHYKLRVAPSCTDPEASILLLSDVRAKSRK